MKQLNYAVNFNYIIHKPNRYYSYNIIKHYKKDQIEEGVIEKRSMRKEGLIFIVLILVSPTVFIPGQQKNYD